MGMREMEAYSRKQGVPMEYLPWIEDQKNRLKNFIRSGEYDSGYGQTVKNGTGNISWWNEKGEFDTNHYNNAANAWNIVIKDKKWQGNMGKNPEDKALMKNIVEYLEYRGQTANILNARGGATLASVPSLEDEYNNKVYKWKETKGFTEWFNRYFEGDTIK
jgi:hypothetical protein